MTGWGRGRGRKMGYEASSPRRKRVDGRITQGGVEFAHNALTDQVTCTLCGQYGSSADLAYMLTHAATHWPEEVARVTALGRLTATLQQLDAAALELLGEVLPAVVANPAGFRVVAQALASGAVKHPGRGLGPSPDQVVSDHVDALSRHAGRSWAAGGGLAIDHDTGLPHAGLATARGMLAIQRAAQEGSGA